MNTSSKIVPKTTRWVSTPGIEKVTGNELLPNELLTQIIDVISAFAPTCNDGKDKRAVRFNEFVDSRQPLFVIVTTNKGDKIQIRFGGRVQFRALWLPIAEVLRN